MLFSLGCGMKSPGSRRMGKSGRRLPRPLKYPKSSLIVLRQCYVPLSQCYPLREGFGKAWLLSVFPCLRFGGLLHKDRHPPDEVGRVVERSLEKQRSFVELLDGFLDPLFLSGHVT